MYVFSDMYHMCHFVFLFTYTILSVVITRLSVRFQHVQIFVRRIPFSNECQYIWYPISFVLFEQLYELTSSSYIILYKYQRQQTHTYDHD
jgi:hypothetical protein